MSAKRGLLIILVASAMLLAVGTGSRTAGSVRALPAEQRPGPGGVTIPYAGHLSDDAGQPVTEGNYAFTFTLYHAETGGEPLWSEVQEGVAVKDGEFAVFLGSVTPLPADRLAGKETLWLAVGVRGPSEAEFTALVPRQRLSTTSPASPTNGAACPHDHFGESWVGTGSDGLLVATNNWTGLTGWSDSYIGVAGISTPYTMVWPSGRSYGVLGYSYSDHGVYGRTNGDWSYHSGVFGEASKENANGVTGWNTGAGVGVYGYSASGVAGHFTNTSSSSDNPTVEIKNNGAGQVITAYDQHGTKMFNVSGNGIVSAVAYLTWGADMAEMLPAVEGLGPGDVLVIGPDGKLIRSTQAYQSSVAGVYSTQPGFVAGKPVEGETPGSIPLAMGGVVPVKVSAENGAIQPGDLLVASATPGHAMKAGPNPPQGTVIGKALEKWDTGVGSIKMLAVLQ
jgi:hypothetical protein